MNYEKVPTIISTKDLDYLEDMFNWNYLAYKKMINSIDMINNLEIFKRKLVRGENGYSFGFNYSSYLQRGEISCGVFR